MTTANAITLTVDRAAQDELRRLVIWDAPDAEDLKHHITKAEPDRARAVQRKFALLLDVMDELGWEQDMALQEREITVDGDALAEWLVAKREELELFIVDDTADLRHQEAGHDGYFHPGKSQHESVAEVRRMIEKHQADVAVIDGLLAQLTAAVVA